MMTNQAKPKIAITLGDPAGIGTEVVLKALAEPSLAKKAEITLIGSYSVLQQTINQLQGKLNPTELADPKTLSVIDIPLKAEITPGIGNAITGSASFAYLEQAIKRTQKGQFQGIVTAPIAKSYWQAAGYNYPGQTEVLAQMSGSKKFGMLFVARSPFTGFTLRTLLATTHIPLSQVPTTLTPELMELKLDLLLESLTKDFGIKNPKIFVSGLNPHSGEQGKIGTEEQDWLIPWLENERKKRPLVSLIGPVPPDTLWVKPGQAWFHSIQPGIADAYLALYHDQGLIPVKLMAFDQAINTTIGLPFIRTSPDHGTAFDIAGQGIAKPDSMKAAIALAIELISHKLSVVSS